MSRILIVSTDVVGNAMAGPGIRAWELAHALAAYHHTVTLAVPGGSDRQPEGLTLVPYTLSQRGSLSQHIAAADAVVGQGFVFQEHPELLTSDRPLAIDLYDPLVLESLDLYASATLEQANEHHYRYQVLTEALLRRGDFFFCATPTQRDYWLGALTAIGRITPALVRGADRDLRSFIDLVPSGIASQPPALAATPVLRGTHPSIAPHDMILLWAGGLWDWFDPDVIIRALANLRDTCPTLRLCFFAGARPNPHAPPFRTAVYERARQLALQLGVLNQSVLFLEDWIAYDARGAYLAEADIGVSAHLPGIETRFAFRTRLLDYLWSRLPLICSAGDSLGEEIVSGGGGLAVAPGDVAGWEEALAHMAQDESMRTTCRTNTDQIARRYVWKEVARPLEMFCANPRRPA